MLASRLLPFLTDLGESGFEVYVMDFRGYGQSQGKRRLKAIVSDYKEMAENLLPGDERKRFLYGISFGGIIVSNVIGSGLEFNRAIIDSAPSRLSTHGCEEKYDPVANVSKDAPKILVIAGEEDHIIKPVDSLELREAVERHGGVTFLAPDLSHPFMDSPEGHKERMKLIKNYLLGEKTMPHQ